MDNQSRFDPTRKTVGAAYLEAAKNCSDKTVTCGDLTNELMSSLVTDLNETIMSKPFDNKPFYIEVHEKKDLQMPRAIHRTIQTTLLRPAPCDDKIVFWAHPVTNEVRFCWCLPHKAEMDNMLNCPDLFDHEMLTQIKAWKMRDFQHFGFMKDEMGVWIDNPNFKDKPMKTKPMSNLGLLLPATYPT
jgi:hypothetical protein